MEREKEEAGKTVGACGAWRESKPVGGRRSAVEQTVQLGFNGVWRGVRQGRWNILDRKLRLRCQEPFLPGVVYAAAMQGPTILYCMARTNTQPNAASHATPGLGLIPRQTRHGQNGWAWLVPHPPVRRGEAAHPAAEGVGAATAPHSPCLELDAMVVPAIAAVICTSPVPTRSRVIDASTMAQSVPTVLACDSI